MIRVAICDDEIGTCSDIENIVLNYARRQALKIDTEVFYSGETLFQAIENKDNYDRVFLDIQLLELDGVQVGKQIREQLGNERIRNAHYKCALSPFIFTIAMTQTFLFIPLLKY